MNLELIPDEDPRLHTKAAVFNPHEWDDLHPTVDAMFKLMREHNGIGLAAPQVGIPKRLFIMSLDNKEYVCINPTVLKRGKKLVVRDEGCLSYPGQKVLVERPTEVRVSFQNLRGQRVTKKLVGLTARCFLHELDHLDGIVMSDVGHVVS